VFVDQNQIAILKRLNGELKDGLDDRALRQRFKRNVRHLEELASEIMSRITSTRPALTSFKPPLRAGQQQRLTDVFDVLQL
jgi:hypothetical protein